jgi:hypothetical protein
MAAAGNELQKSVSVFDPRNDRDQPRQNRGAASYAVNVPEQYRNKGFNRSNWYPTYDWNVDDGFHKFATWPNKPAAIFSQCM